MTTRRIMVRVRDIYLGAEEQIIQLDIGGRRFTLTSEDMTSARMFAVALQAATSVALEIDEHPRFKMPEDV